MIPMDAITEYLNAHFRPDVAADLLAAAQPLMAIAWSEGHESGRRDPYGLDSNPYRTG